MRAYFFVNMYLIGIHAGIQPQHVTAELFLKNHSEEGNAILLDWATNHKTTIVLNGGYSEELRRLIEFFDTSENPYPWAFFNESKEALDGALTCVGIVIPEHIYSFAESIRKRPLRNYPECDLHQREYPIDRVGRHLSDFEVNLAERMNEYGLAR